MGLRRPLTRLLIVLGALGAAQPAPAEVLRVGTSGDYAPFSVVAPEEASGYLGFDVAVAHAYAEERGLVLELVPFRWAQLQADLAAGRFDLAMSGITVRPDRSVLGRFTVPVLESGAVVLTRTRGRFSQLDQLDRPDVRIGVNQGGHLERVTRGRFRRATLVFIPDNAAVRSALDGFLIDAAVSDTFEGPIWKRDDPELGLLGPFTRDRKAYLLRADRPELAADLDAWLLAREADGSLARLRALHLGAAAAGAPTATPLGALVAAMDERLSLMPLVASAKRRDVLPVAAPQREARVLGHAVEAVGAAAQRAHLTPPPEAAVRRFGQAQIDAARQVQMSVGRSPDYQPEEPLPDLDTALRPALLRIDARIAALLVALPEGLAATEVERACRQGLRSPWLAAPSQRALIEAVTALSAAPRTPEPVDEPPAPGEPFGAGRGAHPPPPQ
jgi:cyclohexadienyl dehydratase